MCIRDRYFRVDKLCSNKKRREFKLLPITFKKNKTEPTVDLEADELDEMPLEDRIKMNRRK